MLFWHLTRDEALDAWETCTKKQSWGGGEQKEKKPIILKSGDIQCMWIELHSFYSLGCA